MRTIEPTRRFQRDYKREKSNVAGKKIEATLQEVIDWLAQDKPLPKRYADHQLVGEWKKYGDCHVRPDLILIYRKPDSTTLELIRLGSHSELGL